MRKIFAGARIDHSHSPAARAMMLEISWSAHPISHVARPAVGTTAAPCRPLLAILGPNTNRPSTGWPFRAGICLPLLGPGYAWSVPCSGSGKPGNSPG